MKAINLKPMMDLSNAIYNLKESVSIEKKYNWAHKEEHIAAFTAELTDKQQQLDAMIEKKLTPVIHEAEGRATARTLDPVTGIFDLLNRIEKKLNITKKAMDGIKVFADPNAQDFPNAYKYIPESTHFSAEYKRGAWYLTSVSRDTCKSGPRASIVHTEASRAAVIEQNSRVY